MFNATLEMSIGAQASRMALQRMEISKEQLSILNRGAFLDHMADVRDNPEYHLVFIRARLAIDDIVGAILDAHRERPIDCVWIDHLGFIQHPGQRGENIAYRIGLTTKRLAALAPQIDAPVMLLCQLNRAGGDGDAPSSRTCATAERSEQDARWVWITTGMDTTRPAPSRAHQTTVQDLSAQDAKPSSADYIPLQSGCSNAHASTPAIAGETVNYPESAEDVLDKR